MRKPRLNPVFMAMGVWMPALMAGALEECCLQELFGLVIPLLTALGNWTWTVCTQGLYLVYHLNWGTFKSESRWFLY